jgi:AcrR family transcriptional regulator
VTRPVPSEGAHWLLGPDLTRRRKLDAAAIVVEAHTLVHGGGTDALSMRALATSLGTSTSELYRHIPSKPWLLVAVLDLVLGEVDTNVGRERRRSPRRRLESLSFSLRDVLAAHPHVHEILASHVAVTPNTVRLAEAALTCLRGLGVLDRHLVDAYNAWCGYVVGFTAIEVKPQELTPEPPLQRVMRAQLEGATVDGSSVVGELQADLANRAFGLSWRPERFGGSRTSFEWGLQALLDGFERRATPRR